MLLGLAWVLAFFSYAAIWNASVQIGIGTWWVGPRAQPTFILVKLLPFVLCLAMVLCIVYNAPRMVRISAIATVATAIWAIPDFSRSIGLGVAELTVAGLLAIGTAAALTGRYRLAPATASGDSVGETDDHVAVTRPPSALPPPPS